MASRSSKKSASEKGKPKDVVLVYGRTEDGRGFDVLRQRGESVEAGRMQPLADGKPVHGEIVQLKARDDSPALFDVEVQHVPRTSTGRPAKVANEQYRKGWESIWAKKRPNRELN
jgi:hypothetical protein